MEASANRAAIAKIASGQEPQSVSEDEKQRFEVELEFVQCLANPAYLNFLAQNEYLDSEQFIAYLKYLEYWRKPQYARFIVFPQALYFLRLLQQPPFREALKRADYSLMLHQQQGFNWQFEKSMKPISTAVNGAKSADGNAPKPNGNGATQTPVIASDATGQRADVVMRPLPNVHMDTSSATN
ncbi:unnamed protein product [Agarophyton chilense]